MVVVVVLEVEVEEEEEDENEGAEGSRPKMDMSGTEAARRDPRE